MRTRVFQSGNSQAVWIPKEIQFDRLDVEYEIERQGLDDFRVYPDLALENWVEGSEAQ